MQVFTLTTQRQLKEKSFLKNNKQKPKKKVLFDNSKYVYN